VGRASVRVLRVTALLLILASLCGVVGWRWFERTILATLPEDLRTYRDWRPPTSARVYAQDGTLIDTFSIERRIWVPIDQLRPATWQAFVAAEDRRFFEHKGVDPQGILRAAWANFQAGAVRQGGSTITQQLVKNLLVGNERSYERKAREAVLAWRLEGELDKMQLLELFVNFVFLGNGNYGVEAAARDYFGVSARDLDAGQAALLAGIIPASSRYNPRRAPLLAAERRATVLEAMVDEGYLDADAAELYGRAAVITSRRRPTDDDQDWSYATEVRRELRRLLPPGVVFAEGLSVQTPMDPHIQQVAQDSVRQALRDLDLRQGRRASAGHLAPTEWAAFLREASGLPRDPIDGTLQPPKPGQCLEVLVAASRDLGALQAGPFSMQMAVEARSTPVRSAEGKPRPLSQVVRVGDLLPVCVNDDRSLRLDDRPWGEGAAVVLENRSGRVVAVVGGYRVPLEGFVRATQGRRQPGSSFKPYVYTAALLAGRTQLDRVLDGPISMPAGNGKLWSPRNYDGSFAGLLPMRAALARSLNTVAVRLTLEVGAEEVARVARLMGVKSPMRKDPTIGLGSNEVTVMDQALGYATVARMGVPTEAVWIDELFDHTRARVGTAGGPVTLEGEAVAVLPGRPGPRALPAGVAYEMADMLREVVRAGTARKAWKPGYDRAGKTGTTNDFVDAWFVGFTPRYTVAVWIGSDGTQSLGDKETGGKAALPAWMRIVEALPHAEGERFPLPDEAILVQAGGQWVGLPRAAVPASVLRRPTLGAAPLPDFGD
jgi:penicillin-binding protein 1A